MHELKDKIKKKLYELDEYEAELQKLLQMVQYMRQSDVFSDFRKENLGHTLEEELTSKIYTTRAKQEAYASVIDMIDDLPYWPLTEKEDEESTTE